MRGFIEMSPFLTRARPPSSFSPLHRLVARRAPPPDVQTCSRRSRRKRQGPAGGLRRGRAVSARADRLDRRETEAGARDRRRERLQRDLDRAGAARNRRPPDVPRYRSAARERSRRERPRAGLSDIVTVVPGDAFAPLPTTSGSFDFVFLDAWKKDYKRFLDLVLPRLNKGGLFVAHNVVNKKSEMGDFLDAIWKTPALYTTIVSPSSEGMSVSVKR